MFAILGAAITAACTVATASGVARLSSEPSLSGGRYTSGGGLTVAVDLREAAGRTQVCGVWAQSRQQSILTKHVERRVLGAGSVVVDGRRVVTGLNFLREVPPQPDYGGLEGACVTTDRPWNPDTAARASVRIPRQIVHRGGYDAFDAGEPTVYFLPTGPAAGG